MIRCGSFTEVTWVATREKTKVWCQLDDSHTCDHRGRIDNAGMLLTWPRLQSPLMVIKLDGSAPPPAPAPWNAACVIKAAPAEWSSEPSSPLDDILAGAARMRSIHVQRPPWPSPPPEDFGPKVRIE